MNKRWQISRRALLSGMGAVGAITALPVARVCAAAPRRFVVVHVPEGMWTGAPRPSVDGALGPILEPLEPFQSQVTVLNNLLMASRDSGPGPDAHKRAVVHMLTGTEMLDAHNAGGPSVDQVIAQAIGGGQRYQSLQFSVRPYFNDLNARPIWLQAGRVVPALDDPWKAYARFFSDVLPRATNQPVRLDLRRSALDYALQEIAALRPRLSASDRSRLDSYQESLRDIEKRLQNLSQVSCAAPDIGAAIDVKAEANYPKIGRLQMDLLVAALQCDLTRVASLQWGNSNDQCAYSWLGVNAVGHALSHNLDNCDPEGTQKLKVYRWYAEQFAYLLGKLAAIPEDGGSMLANTCILWVSEFGNSLAHSEKNLMWVLMGNVGGYFRTGRVLDCGGRPTNDVLTSLCNAYGLPQKTFGNPAFCGGPITELR